MLGKTYDTQICSIARSLEVIGERWSLLIVREALFGGITRFSDFQHNLGIATNVLTARLDAFVEDGIMTRRRYSAQPEQYEYVLTAKGRDLAASLIALTQWGDRWATRSGKLPIIYRHADCDGAIDQVTVCATCGPVPATEVVAQPGPGMPAAYLANLRRRRES